LVQSYNDIYQFGEREDIIAIACGGYYQWGRMDQGSDFMAYTRHGNHLNFPMTAECAHYSLIGGYDGFQRPYPPNDKFIFNTNFPFDWHNPPQNNLWGNGFVASMPTPGGWPGTAHPENNYQQPVRSLADPCPFGWRVPTQDDFETLLGYCDPADVTSTTYDLSSGIYHSPTGFTWVAYKVDWKPGDPIMFSLPASNTGWYYNEFTDNLITGGYMIFKTTDYEKATSLGWDPALDGTRPGYPTGCFCLNPPCTEIEPTDWCIWPYLWLPTTGYRMGKSSDCNIQDKGVKGLYWTSTVETNNLAWCLEFDANTIKFSAKERVTGCAVRCVVDTP
jgi:hypothetical protein